MELWLVRYGCVGEPNLIRSLNTIRVRFSNPIKHPTLIHESDIVVLDQQDGRSGRSLIRPKLHRFPVQNIPDTRGQIIVFWTESSKTND